MKTYEKGVLLAEGKTKKIWKIVGDDDNVIIESKDDITAFDNPDLTKRFNTKAGYATNTTCRVFELLKKAGIPTAYVEQISSTEFVAPKCSMIPLEVVARRYAVGSYLKRNPNYERPKGKPPLRFHRLVVEFFLKTTKGKLVVSNNQIIVEGLDPKKKEEDPFILNPCDEKWTLMHSKKPVWDSSVKLREGIDAFNILKNISIDTLENHLRDTFLVLEGMWAILGHRLIDLKIEFGITEKGELLVADVIDNDSWRLRDQNWEELSKEAFRQGEKLNEVERKYGVVSGLVNNFRVPKQCLFMWRDSNEDRWSDLPEDLNLKDVGDTLGITASGHKSPQKCLNILEDLLGKYPEGGVIIVKVDMSNGLGPMLAARTSWPVISIPASLDKNPEDIWSNVRMPSRIPMAVIFSDANAFIFALNILAQKNPLVYRQIQKKIEELDD